jgi:hypothetical protein
MKRIGVAIVAVVVFVGALIFLASDRRKRPRFITADLPAYAPYKYLTYWQRPQICSDKFWLSTWSATNDFQSFLFDIAQGKAVGQLVNAAPLALNSNATKVLCLQRKNHTPGFVHKARSFLEGLLLSRTRPALDAEVLWIVDLRKNSAVKLGQLLCQPNSGFSPMYCADLRHVLLRNAANLYLCDLQKNRLTKIGGGHPVGWWNERQILFFSGGAHELYDIYTQQVSALLTEAQIETFLQTAGFAPKVSSTTRYFMPRGHVTEIYIPLLPGSDNQSDTSLVKFDRTTGALKVIARKFNGNWAGEFDSAERYFLFSERGKGGFRGLYLQDLQTDEVRTLVTADEQPFLYRAFFHGDTVLFVQSNMLWQTDLRGSNKVPLFPSSKPPD